MILNNRIDSFIQLGKFLTKYTSQNAEFTHKELLFAKKMDNAVISAIQHNGWFTHENIIFNLKQWGENLTEENLHNWVKDYTLQPKDRKTVAIIMAGNVPLVGFHDFLSVLISGHKALIKQSSKDKKLLPCLVNFLKKENKSFAEVIEFTDKQLQDFDAVIATGSNNTARYFEYYFAKKPHLIRKNRNSVAVLNGKETKEELALLGEDIFRYYGLGCRNVSKIFVPKNYNFKNFFEAIYDWNDIINHHKYANNYDYNKAVYLMSEVKLFENGFFLLKEDRSYSSPIACLFYEFYEDENTLQKRLEEDENEIQCVVDVEGKMERLQFGETQQPQLQDYADGIDTLTFLDKI